jgi:hypothetical protein
VLQAWELTYINHISTRGAVFPGDVWNFLEFYKDNPEAITAKDAKGDRLAASNMLLHFNWKLPDNAGLLSMDVKHGLRVPDQAQVLALELTCRGDFDAPNAELHGRFAIGHEAIVNTFAKLTTEQGHEMWGKTE